MLLQLHRLVHEYPVLLMPTHRSYIDFLFVGYILYEYDLPLPIVAAAMGESLLSLSLALCPYIHIDLLTCDN